MKALVAAGALVVLVSAVIAGDSVAGLSHPLVRNGPIVFDGVDKTTGSLQIWRLSPNGHGLRQLTHTTVTSNTWNENPAWSLNGTRIFFDSAVQSNTYRIYRMNANGTGRRLVDRPPSGQHQWPSPGSGRWLALVGYGKSGNSEIMKMRTNGRGLRVLAKAKHEQMVYGPDYAPRGNRITFGLLTFHKNGQGIARSDIVVRAGGRNVVITKRYKAQYSSPAWAPDGNSLVAARGQDGKTVVRMKPDGTHVRVLTKVPAGIESIVYSPDGRRLAASLCKGDCGDPLNFSGRGSIWIMNANGSGKHAILRQDRTGIQPAARLDWARR